MLGRAYGGPTMPWIFSHMKKLLCAAMCLSTFSVACLVSTGCGPEVRKVEPMAGQPKPNFKSAIQNNPNIPDNVKKSFK
jgi:hypothetical protein